MKITKSMCKQAIVRVDQQKQLTKGYDSGGLQMLGLLDTEDILPKNVMLKEGKKWNKNSKEKESINHDLTDLIKEWKGISGDKI